MEKERRKLERRKFSYYMPVVDPTSTEQVGIIVDISPGGFKVDSLEPIPKGQVNHLCLFLTSDFAPQVSLVFAGRSKWCSPDYVDPTIYNIGYELINLSPKDTLTYQRVFEKFGSHPIGNSFSNDNYFWK